MKPDDCKTDKNITEDVWLEVTKNHETFLIGGIYRHPNSDVKMFTEHMDYRFEMLQRSKKQCIIAGDLNIDLSKFNVDRLTENYLSILFSNNVLPVIYYPTRIAQSSATIIDHIYWCNNKNCNDTTVISGNLYADVSDHLPNFIFINKTLPINKISDRPMIRIYSDKNNKNFCEYLRNVDWGNILYKETDTNRAYDNFFAEIRQSFETNFPLQRLSRRGSKDKIWITRGLKISSCNKKKLYKKWIISHDKNDFDKYKKYNKIFKAAVKECQVNHYKSIFNSKTNSMKQIWTEINRICSFRKTRSKPQISKLIINNHEITDPQTICEEFNKYFCTVGSKLSESIAEVETNNFNKFLPAPLRNSIFLEPVTKTELNNLIISLNPRKSSGHDGISVKLIQNAINDIIDPLLFVLNLSFETGTFPSELKIAKVIPLHKKGNLYSTTNYRPISLLSNFGKIFEKLMYVRIMSFLKSHNILYKYQFGFRSHHSTSLALIDVADTVYHELDSGNYVIGTFLDLQKAFDTVNHAILLQKLQCYGIRGKALQWMSCYLTNRLQYVSIGDIQSRLENISCGVPQGSVLGPLLFLLYINDIHSSVPNSKLKLFADDTSLFTSGKNVNELITETNAALSNLNNWFISNKLSLSIEKTSFSFFSPCNERIQDLNCGRNLILNNTVIKHVNCCKYLGVYIDENMSWLNHVEFVKNKLLRFVGIFYKMRSILPSATCKQLYFALLYPHLIYGVELYANTTENIIDPLVKMNNRLLRILQNKNMRTHVCELYKAYNTLPIQRLHELHVAKLIQKFVHNCNSLPDVYRNYFCANSLVHSHDTRRSHDMQVERKGVNWRLFCSMLFQCKFSRSTGPVSQICGLV